MSHGGRDRSEKPSRTKFNKTSAKLKPSRNSQSCTCLQSCLHQAVLQGDKAKVEQLLQQDLAIDLLDISGKTALQIAVEEDREELVALLLTKNAKITNKVLLAAGINLGSGSVLVSKMRILLWLAVEPEPKNLELHSLPIKSLLLHAVIAQKIEILSFTLSKLQHKISIGSMLDINGRSILNYAATNGLEAIVQVLLEALQQNDEKQFINTLDANGYTPLHCAVLCKHRGLVQRLLDYGADPSIADRYHMTSIQIAESLDQSDLSKLLLDRKASANRSKNLPVLPQLAEASRKLNPESLDLSVTPWLGLLIDMLDFGHSESYTL